MKEKIIDLLWLFVLIIIGLPLGIIRGIVMGSFYGVISEMKEWKEVFNEY